MAKDHSFSRFFNPHKSPQRGFNAFTGTYYFPKHPKRRGYVFWDSYNKGTYKKDQQLTTIK